MKKKVYLGDGAYVEFTGFDFVLTTEDGKSVQNRITMDTDMIEALYRFLKQCTGEER